MFNLCDLIEFLLTTKDFEKMYVCIYDQEDKPFCLLDFYFNIDFWIKRFSMFKVIFRSYRYMPEEFLSLPVINYHFKDDFIVVKIRNEVF